MYFVEKIKTTDFVRQFDYALFIAVLLLSGLGIAVLASATNNMADGTNIMTKQVISLAIGMIVALVASAIDYKDFKPLGIILYAVSIVLLVVVIFKGTGRETWGSNSWLNIPVVGSFQPSEIAKIAVIIVSSIFLERMKEGQGGRNAIKFAVYSLIPVFLVLAQPDAGTAIVFLFVLAAMLFLSGLKYRYIIATVCAFLVSMPLMWLFVLREHQKSRIMTFLNPELDPAGKGFQVIRSKLAIGSGQLYGKSLFNGIQTQNGGVPVRESDFIFTVVGEELGFIGSAAMIVLIFFILFRSIYIARHSRDYFGSYLAAGLACMMGFHFVENIGMCIGILPVTGIPLPFVSAGGSAMVTNFFAVGLILSVSMRRRRNIFNMQD